MSTTLIKNIGQLVTPLGISSKKGKDQGNVLEIKNAAVLIKDGFIAYVGKEDDAVFKETPFDREIDAQGNLVTPGIVDCHTHLVFGGWRHYEFQEKLAGVPYLDILKKGGGILSTVKSTREASFEELFTKAYEISVQMVRHGTTTIEAKSGYGLNLEDEIKQLEVVQELKKNFPIDIVSTFLGAHAVPGEYQNDDEGYINFLIKDVLPVVKERDLARYCDIFCETGVFDAALSEKYLKQARDMGFGLKIHADEINPIGGGELAGKLGADSAEHLIAATDEGIKMMAKQGTIGVLLPATSFYLDKPFARARTMLENGMAVAVASDFNPGSSPNFNMQIPMNLACLKYKLTPEEALTAVTINGAAAIGMAHIIGSIEQGKQGDMVIWDAPDLNYIFYRYGNNQAQTILKKGTILIDHNNR